MGLLRELRAAWAEFVAWFNARRLDENTILLAFSLAVGVAGALGVVVFFKLIDLFFYLLYRLPVEHVRGIDYPVYRPIVTAAGFAVAAWFARRFAGGSGEQTEFPVVDPSTTLVGMITLADLARVAQNQEDLAPLLVAADIAQPTESITPEQSLLEAMRRMGVRGSGSIPVVDAAGRLRGLVTRGHILAAYERAVAGVAPALPRPDLVGRDGGAAPGG